MRMFLSATKRFFAEIWSDAMLAALFFVPLIMAPEDGVCVGDWHSGSLASKLPIDRIKPLAQ